MIVLPEDVSKFQELYKKLYGVDISQDDAYEKGMKLLQLIQLVLDQTNGRY